MPEVRRADPITIPRYNREAFTAAFADEIHETADPAGWLADADFDIHDHMGGRGDLDIDGYDGNDFAFDCRQALGVVARFVENPATRRWWIIDDSDDASSTAVLIYDGKAVDCPVMYVPVAQDRGPRSPEQVQAAMFAAGDTDLLDKHELEDILAALLWGLVQWDRAETIHRLQALVRTPQETP